MAFAQPQVRGVALVDVWDDVVLVWPECYVQVIPQAQSIRLEDPPVEGPEVHVRPEEGAVSAWPKGQGERQSGAVDGGRRGPDHRQRQPCKTA